MEDLADGWPAKTLELAARDSYWMQRAYQTNAYARRKGARGRVSGQDLRRIWTGFCFWCECRIALGAVRGGLPMATVDHVVPMGSGGLNEIENLVWACWSCNNVRGTQHD